MAESTDSADDRGVTQGAWMDMVRRSRISREIKLAMLAFGSYANADGTGIYCGVARLAADCGISYRTAGRYLSWGRRVGLVELVKRGNRRRRQADEYRLIVGPDLLQQVTIPDPDEYRALVGEIASANRADSKQRQHRRAELAKGGSTDTDDDRRTEDGNPGDLRTQGGRKNDAPEDPSTDTRTTVGTGFYGHQALGSTDIPDVLPPLIEEHHTSIDLPWVPSPRRNARYHSARAREGDDAGSTDNPLGDGDPMGTAPWNAADLRSTARQARVPGPTCDTCGAELDPDGSCFICPTPIPHHR